jgi:hypothetical protein
LWIRHITLPDRAGTAQRLDGALQRRQPILGWQVVGDDHGPLTGKGLANSKTYAAPGACYQYSFSTETPAISGLLGLQRGQMLLARQPAQSGGELIFITHGHGPRWFHGGWQSSRESQT